MFKVRFLCQLLCFGVIAPGIAFSSAESRKIRADVARAKQGLAISDLHEIWMDVQMIRPGQTEVGRDEAIARFLDPKHLGFSFTPVLAMSQDGIFDYLRSRPVPVIQGPDGNLVAVDRHHMMLGVLYLQKFTSLKIRPEVFVRITADWSKHVDGTPVTRTEFERRLLEHELINPYRSDEGRDISFNDFPRSPLDLRNSPVRSFVWVLRQKKLIVKTAVPHWERRWTRFLANYRFPKDFQFPKDLRFPNGVEPRKIFKVMAKRPMLTRDLILPAVGAFRSIPASDYPDQALICSLTARGE